MKWHARALLAHLAACAACAAAAEGVDLSGQWHVEGVGFSGPARLPGTLADAGYGDRQDYGSWYATSNKMERYALRISHRYVGKAVWSRRVQVDESLSSRPLELFLERAMWSSRLRIDGRDFGMRDSLGTPHVYRLPAGTISPGEHVFEIEVDNSRHYGFSGWSHAWGPTTQTRWNGVIGRIELREHDPLRSARVFASWPANGSFEIDVDEGAGLSGVSVEGLAVAGWTRNGRRVRVSFEGEPEYWSPERPRRYRLALVSPEGRRRTLQMAFRTFERRGRRLYLNGVPFWVRGDVDNCQFPLTGYPSMTPAEWRRQIRVQQLNGCNAMRAHTWTPPEAAYEAADELGFVWMVECGFWADGWMQADGAGRGNAALDAYLHDEIMRVADAYGGHPSVMSLSVGNELGTSDFALLDRWMREVKARDGRFLTTATSAREICPSDDYSTTHNYPGIGAVRCWRRPHTNWDYEEAYAKAPIPVVAHEIGQWPVYPYWDDLSHFSGLLRPFDWQWMRSLAASNGTLRFTRRWHSASMKTSRLMYKDEVESFLRTPSCAGMQLLDVRDYTGQGEALVGWLDADFKAKPAVSEVPPFSSVLRPVPFLARFGKYVWTSGETFEAELQVRNLTERPLPAGLSWPWSFAGKGGYARLERELPPYEIATVGVVRRQLACGERGERLELRFGENSWNLWVFPDSAKASVPPGVTMTSSRDEACAALSRGERVLFTGKGRTVGKGRFVPVYWSSVHFPARDPSVALGTWFDEDHPALAGFPTEDWMDWQWRSLAEGATVHVLRNMPTDFEAVAMPVSDIHFSELLATMFELRCGSGRLFVCGYDLDADTPESRALRASLFAYVSGSRFNPAASLSPDAVAELLTPDPCAVCAIDGGDLRVAKSAFELAIDVVHATPVQGKIAVKFDEVGDVEGTFEGRPLRVERMIDGEMRLVAQMNREDALDGQFKIRCRARSGTLPRYIGVEIEPE